MNRNLSIALAFAIALVVAGLAGVVALRLAEVDQTRTGTSPPSGSFRAVYSRTVHSSAIPETDRLEVMYDQGARMRVVRGPRIQGLGQAGDQSQYDDTLLWYHPNSDGSWVLFEERRDEVGLPAWVRASDNMPLTYEPSTEALTTSNAVAESLLFDHVVADYSWQEHLQPLVDIGALIRLDDEELCGLDAKGIRVDSATVWGGDPNVEYSDLWLAQQDDVLLRMRMDSYLHSELTVSEVCTDVVSVAFAEEEFELEPPAGAVIDRLQTQEVDFQDPGDPVYGIANSEIRHVGSSGDYTVTRSYVVHRDIQGAPDDIVAYQADSGRGEHWMTVQELSTATDDSLAIIQTDTEPPGPGYVKWMDAWAVRSDSTLTEEVTITGSQSAAYVARMPNGETWVSWSDADTLNEFAIIATWLLTNAEVQDLIEALLQSLP